MSSRLPQHTQRHRLSTALFAVLAASAGHAAAQSESGVAPGTTDLDKVTVTGSRIARTGFVTPSPVTAISAEEIRATGATTISDLMARMPALAPSYTLGNSTRFIGTAGLGLLDLRGMGVDRTLVLVNGRRHVGSSPGSTAVDVNTIPVEWVERVEVITGGASAVYGADAVAGVVNFILKKNFTGFETRAQTGLADEGNYNRSFASFSAGTDFADGRGNIAVSGEYSKQDRFGRGNRAIGREYLVSVPNPAFDPSQPPSERNPQNVLSGPGGNHSTSYGGTFNLGTFDFRNPASYGNRYLFNQDGSFRRNRYNGPVVSNTSCVDCDFVDLNAVADLQPGFDRKSVNTMINFEISANHRLFFEGKYSETDSEFFGQPAFDSSLRVRRQNPYVSPELGALMDSRGATQILMNRFNVDAGRRGENIERKTYRAVLGAEGNFTDNWSYDVSANYGKTTVDRLNLNNRINERWQAGIDAARDASGNIVCRTTLDPGAINPHTNRVYSALAREGCVPFSVFGNGAVTPEAGAWFNTTARSQAKIQQTVFSASVANSNLLSLPAGDIGFAGGVEYRKEQSEEITDPLAASGVTFLNAIPNSGGEYTVKEIFVESTIPLLAGLPGVDRLALDVAGRYSDYDSIGSTKTWNVGLDWTIIPSLRLRGTLAQAVRAPSIGELYDSQSENFATINDPCNYLPTNTNRPGTAGDVALRQANCSALGVPVGWIDTFTSTRPGVSGGNPELKPERARSLSYGLVWQPEFFDGFGMSIDYWRIDLQDAIGTVTAETNATRCVDNPGGIDNSFCGFVQRAPLGGFTDPQGRIYPEHSIIGWQALNENLSRSRRVGVDLEMDYRFQVGEGNTVLRLVGTRLIQSREWVFQDFPAEYDEYVTYVTDPRWRAQFQTKYNWNEWRASWDMNYVDGNLRVTPESYNSNPGSASPIRNGSYTYHNFQFGYQFPGSKIDVYLGIDNAFDKDPPRNYFGSDFTSALYDNVGRFFYLGTTVRF
ncbi:TonB-dependent receptor plug domain-containing protein [Xanthomonas euroxanthea]|uniref:TonB-dependent receptor plug domain-containing protein n=1 Tax=Xanthomonas euroxanthea TaxID=2259622 RepID=UPI000E20697C|nr:TonB-dependent receptor [Xanthomonas euroxanthea]CAE1137290.1 TonB-dependent receptor [Xanthomonas euroxanthea]